MSFQEQLPIVLGSLNSGFLQTLRLFAITLLGAIPLGLVIAFGSMSRLKPLAAITRVVVWVVRGTPLMIQLLIIYYFPGLMLKTNWWGSGESGRFLAAAIAFIFNYACYFSEIYRGGIQSVPVGQQEAGLVLGMTRPQIFFRVTLLQVIKRIVPPMSNEVITLVKDTSLAFTLAYQEVFSLAKQISASQTSFTPFVIAGVFYFIANYAVAFAMERIEKALDYYR